jgi:hypothetical protein
MYNQNKNILDFTLVAAFLIAAPVRGADSSISRAATVSL